MSRDDDEKAEMHELMDMPEWKARKIVQDRFNEADAEFREWQMTSEAFRVQSDKDAPASGQHYLRHLTDKVVGWVDGSTTRCRLVGDVKAAIHFKSEESARKFLTDALEQKQFDF